MCDAPIFIVGCPRSGTGLLRDLLRSHPAIGIPLESHFIPALYRAYGDPEDDRQARRLASAILRTPWVRRWNLDLAPDDLAECRSYALIASRVFAAAARRQGARRWGDKTPLYVLELPLLVELFPDARIVHIHRDGRDVALSQLRAHVGPEDVVIAADLWRRCIEAGRAFGAAAGAGMYHEIRYEDLLADPRATMTGVCDFLEEPFVEAVLRPSFLERFSRGFIVGTRDRAAVSETEIVPGNHSKWKTAMSRRDRALFESVAGETLRDLRYEIEGLSRRLTRADQIGARIRHGARYIIFHANLGQKRLWLSMSAWMWWAHLRHLLRRAGLAEPSLNVAPPRRRAIL